MVAQLRPEPAALPLLLEPDPPAEGGRAFGDDRIGALVQHAIVRYLVHGVQRQQIARELHYSEREIQTWVSGRAYRRYAEPVRRALRGLGIGMGRGGVSPSRGRRGLEVADACLSVLEDTERLLRRAQHPEAERLRQLARLLTAGREPLNAGGTR